MIEYLAEHHIQVLIKLFAKSGLDILDVGANRGWLTIPFSNLVGPLGRVAAIEASPRNLKLLNESIHKYCRFSNVEVFNAAAWNTSGETISMFENIFSNADSIFFSGDGATKITVKTLKIDDIVFSRNYRPNIIKMDIEGAEYDALLGMGKTIEKFLPIVILELRASDIRPLRFLEEYNYKFFSCLGLSRIEILSFDFADFDYLDVLCLPVAGDFSSMLEFIDISSSIVFEKVDFDLTVGLRSIVLHSIVLLSGVNYLKMQFSWTEHKNVHENVQVFAYTDDGLIVAQYSGKIASLFQPFGIVCSLNASCSKKITIIIRFDKESTANYHSLDITVKHVPLDDKTSILQVVNLAMDHNYKWNCDETLTFIEKLVNNHDYNVALASLKSLSFIEHLEGKKNYLVGVCLWQLGFLEEALLSIINSLEKNFDPFWANLRAAQISIGLQKISQAKIHILEAEKHGTSQEIDNIKSIIAISLS